MKAYEIYPITDPATRQRVNVKRAYYDQTLTSTFTPVAAAAFGGFKFFNAQENALLRNYDLNNGNPLQSGEGRIFSLTGKITNANFSEPVYSTDAIRQEAYTLREVGELEIKFGGDTGKKVAFSELFIETPVVLEAAANTPTAATQWDTVNLENQGSTSKMISLGDPAPLITAGVRTDFIPTVLNAFVFTNLAGYFIVMRMRVRQYYGGVISMNAS